MDYNSKIFLIGSCFVKNIGGKLEYFKFQNKINPLGILFHPAAIARFFERVANQTLFTESDLVFHNERWHCMDAHSQWSGNDPKNVLENLNNSIKEATDFLQNATHVIITLGTAWGYRYKKTGKPVANCHKIPQKEFDKELAGIDAIYADLASILAVFQEINPQIRVVFTVSPVRHLKDGFVENQRSKAHLIAAVHQVIEKKDRAEYFPSYEIMMDELRDYRFYDRDLLHPNPLAVDYIWEKFVHVYLSPKAQQWAEKIDEVQRAIAHRPFNPDSEAHGLFQKKLERKKKQIEENLPNIRF